VKTIKVLSTLDGLPTFDQPIQKLLDECVPGSVIQLLTPDEFLGLQQIRWFKGVLLPALAKDSGDSVEYWETTLKLAVMPDEFAPFYVPIGKQVFPVIPSITKLSKAKMNQLIQGSVAKCHEYGLTWVTLPDSELSKAKEELK
jgi:hypothetical protein